ncbi:ferritin-like protein [Streptomyces triculaminicus]|uniref:ferritin-like domain-containing protein n=1 Tax=Streptomyces triculaminicus TaxID=2816232 RepID=UPI0033EA8AE1
MARNAPAPAPVPPITTLPDLIDHLKAAAQVELSTIPLYLYATYSIKTRGYSQWAAGASAQRTMIGISIEEMLHLTLVRNLLIAVGDTDFRLYDKNVVPTYPSPMLKREPELMLRLRKLSTDQVANTFMGIELPDQHLKELLGDIAPYDSLGEFYARIEQGIRNLSPTGAIDWTKAKKDLWKFHYHRGYWNQNGGSDQPLVIVDENSALQAMQIIVDQGEGAPGDDHRLPDPIVRTDDYPPEQIGKWQASHFAKFSDIAKGLDGIGVIVDDNGKQKYTIDDSEVIWPLLDDPKLATVDADQPVKDLMEFSNAVYCYVLALLDTIYRTPMEAMDPGNKQPFTDSTRYAYERGFVAVMQGVLYPVADLLVRTPLKASDVTTHAGPPFEFYSFTTKNAKGHLTPKADLVALCGKLLESFPALGGDDGVQRQIALLPDIELT